MRVDANSARRTICGALGIAVLAGTGLLATVAAHADDLKTIKANGAIRVAIDLGVPPFGMKDQALQPTGSDVGVAEILAKDLGVKLEIIPTTGANRIPFLLTNKADIVISSLSITPERAKVIAFSVPYAAIQAVVAAPKSMNIKSMQDLVGKTVIATRGTTNDIAVTKLAPPGTNIVRFDDDATSITAVISGQGDIFATAPPLLKVINEKAPDKHMETKPVMSSSMLGVGLDKKNTELKDWIDNWVRANLKNGKLNTIYEKFQGSPLPEDVLSAGS